MAATQEPKIATRMADGDGQHCPGDRAVASPDVDISTLSLTTVNGFWEHHNLTMGFSLSLLLGPIAQPS